MRTKRAVRLIVLIIMAIFLLPLSGLAGAENNDAVVLYALNVGKADCLFISSDDRWYMIDAGYEYNYPLIRTFIDAMGIEQLDGVFLTHCDKDHTGGLKSLAESDVKIEKWYASACYYDIGKQGHPMEEAAAVRGDKVTWLRAGDMLQDGNVTIHVLGPVETNYNNENNNSLVMTVSNGADRVLLCGDMKVEEEAQLVMRGVIPSCQVIKIGHHGDNNATTDALIGLARPSAAVISTSTVEEADTPATSVLRTLIRYGVNPYVTQDVSTALRVSVQNGDVTVSSYQPESLPMLPEGIVLELDAANDMLTICNNGPKQVELQGCTLGSANSGKSYQLPYLMLLPLQKCTVGSKKTPDTFRPDCVISKKRVWKANDGDCAVLMDASGRRIAVGADGVIR